MTAPRITAPLSTRLQSMLTTQSMDIFSEYYMVNQHFHYYDTAQFAINIHHFQSILSKRELTARIHFAHKANEHSCFVTESKNQGIGIEVASNAELEHAIEHGFSGPDIIAGGIKNDIYLARAIETGCLIVLDGHYELDSLIHIANGRNVNVLYRIGNISIPGRTIHDKHSKFGWTIDHIRHALIQTPQTIINRGLHYHTDESTISIRAERLYMILKFLVNHAPYRTKPILNIGGGRGWMMYDESSVIEYMSWLVNRIKQKQSPLTWGDHTYGLTYTSEGTIGNISRARAHFPTKQGRDVLDAVLNEDFAGSKLGHILADSGLDIRVEPGGSLLVGAGMTVMPVLGTKSCMHEINAVICDTNIHNISAKMIEYHADPILLQYKTSKQYHPKHADNEYTNHIYEGWTGYVTGNLCRPDDILIRRQITLDHQPQRGDLLILPNTAGYLAHFDDAQPHKHPLGKVVVI